MQGAILRGKGARASAVQKPWTQVGPSNHVLDGGAHRRHLANTTEQSMCDGYVAFLSNNSDHLFTKELLPC